MLTSSIIISLHRLIPIKALADSFLNRNCPQLAAAISFYALFSFPPLVLALISAAGFFVNSEYFEVRLAQFIGDSVPISKDFVTDTVEGVIRTRAVTGIAGLVALFWGSNAVFSAIRKGVNAAWGISERRSFVREKFIDGVVMLSASFLMFISFTSTILSPAMDMRIQSVWPIPIIGVDLLMGRILPVVLTVVTFSMLYRYLPNKPLSLRGIFPGAVAGAVAFEVTKEIFIWYIGSYSTHNVVYGPISGIVSLLAWVYTSALIFLFWAVAAAHYTNGPLRDNIR